MTFPPSSALPIKYKLTGNFWDDIRAVKNIAFSADAQLIELAREEARARRTTLNSLFREWIYELARRDERRAKADEAIRNLSDHLSFDRKLTGSIIWTDHNHRGLFQHPRHAKHLQDE